MAISRALGLGVPAQGSAGSASGPGFGVFTLMPRMVPSGVSALEPSRKPEQMSRMTRPGPGIGHQGTELGELVGPRAMAKPEMSVEPARSSKRR